MRVRSEEARRERAARILDAGAELMLRIGARRITVDEVADRAGIGKGTVYLHWKTRDQLLLAVLQREVARSLDRLVAALRADPAVAALHKLTEVQFLGVMRQPLLRAMYTADSDVLGRSAGLHAAQDDRHHRLFEEYLSMLAEHGLLCADIPVPEISYGYHAVLHGYLNEDSYERGAPDLALERKAQLLATTVRRGFEPPGEIPLEILREICPAVTELFAEAAGLSRASLSGSED